MARRKVGNIFTCDFKDETDYIDVWMMSDLHLGHEDFDLKEYKKYIAWALEKPNRYIIGIGDYIECVTSGRNPGTSLTTQQININGQVETIIKLLEPVKDKIICMTEGNHEQRITKDVQFDIMEHTITPRLNTHYMGYQGWVRLKLSEKQDYYVYLHHGPSKSTSSNPKYHLDVIALKLGYAGEADLIAVGHNHKIFAHKYIQPFVSGDKLYTHDCWAIRTGGFLSYPLYSREVLYPPADVGSPIVRFYKNKHDIEIFHNLAMYRNLN